MFLFILKFLLNQKFFINFFLIICLMLVVYFLFKIIQSILLIVYISKHFFKFGFIKFFILVLVFFGFSIKQNIGPKYCECEFLTCFVLPYWSFDQPFVLIKFYNCLVKACAYCGSRYIDVRKQFILCFFQNIVV